MNVAIYARAHDPRGSQRLEIQLDDCRRACRREGWTVVDEYTDLCHAATAPRPGLDALLAAAAGRSFEQVVIASTTRVFRSYDLFDAFVSDLSRVGVAVSVLGMAQPSMILAQVEFAFAAQERDEMRRRTRAGIERRRARR